LSADPSISRKLSVNPWYSQTEVNNEQLKFKAVTTSGLVTLGASELVRANIASLQEKLII
jgi:hypothetical protein